MNESSGTAWKQGEAQRYEVAKHGPDGKVFLDPFLYQMLSPEEVKGKTVLDIGAGTGPWSEYLKKQGASMVVASDLNEQMLRTGKTQGRGEHAHFVQSSASALPHPDNTFDMSVSINVGCNLPNEIETKDGTINIFKEHFKEAYRVAKSGGTMILTAPNSLAEVFTDGADPSAIQRIIDAEWTHTKERSPDSAKNILRKLEHVLRATFILDASGKPILITDENESLVTSGMPIIRKIPGLVVDNIYHTAEEYKEAAMSAGWHITEDHQLSFTHQQVAEHNKSHEYPEYLGGSYAGKPPFLVLKLEKTG